MLVCRVCRGRCRQVDVAPRPQVSVRGVRETRTRRGRAREIGAKGGSVQTMDSLLLGKAYCAGAAHCWCRQRRGGNGAVLALCHGLLRAFSCGVTAHAGERKSRFCGGRAVRNAKAREAMWLYRAVAFSFLERNGDRVSFSSVSGLLT